MSTAPRYPADIGYAGLRMSADEYLALGETQERYELIDGVVVVSPSPTPRHQKVVTRLLWQLVQWQDQQPGAEVFPDTDVKLSSGKVFCPDLVVYGPGRLGKLPERLALAPDVVIEVVSPGSKPLDLITKRDDYDDFGVGEYWVIDPADISARVWRRARGAKMLEVGVERDFIHCAVVPALRIDLAAIRVVMGQA
jgi:Uma2 family endonuclease